MIPSGATLITMNTNRKKVTIPKDIQDEIDLSMFDDEVFDRNTQTIIIEESIADAFGLKYGNELGVQFFQDMEKVKW